ncbi:MAG: DUF92 domain-containing protein [Nitrososphaerota archaeon]
MVDLWLLLEAAAFLGAVSVVVWRTRVLDAAGGAAAVVLGAVVYLTVGRGGAVLLVTFLAVSAAFTRIGYERKRAVGAAELKGGMRGWRNVVGNGGVAGVAALLSALDPSNHHLFVHAFIGSVAAVFADTMATEVGLLSKGKVRRILGFGEARPGEPGGVTALGYVGALAAAAISWAVSVLFFTNLLGPSRLLLAVTLSALVGTTVDSVSGQLLQAVYRCGVCGALTEVPVHCGAPAQLVRGIRGFDNQAVNAVCALTGAVVASVVYLLTG